MQIQLNRDGLDITGPVDWTWELDQTVDEDQLLAFGQSGKFAHYGYQGFG